jgi:hypothetical protein
MKVHKVILTIIDHDDIGVEEIKEILEYTRYANRCISPEVQNIETADIGEWSDDHPLNSSDTCDAEFHRLFPTLPLDK